MGDNSGVLSFFQWDGDEPYLVLLIDKIYKIYLLLYKYYVFIVLGS